MEDRRVYSVLVPERGAFAALIRCTQALAAVRVDPDRFHSADPRPRRKQFVAA